MTGLHVGFLSGRSRVCSSPGTTLFLLFSLNIYILYVHIYYLIIAKTCINNWLLLKARMYLDAHLARCPKGGTVRPKGAGRRSRWGTQHRLAVGIRKSVVNIPFHLSIFYLVHIKLILSLSYRNPCAVHLHGLDSRNKEFFKDILFLSNSF